MKLTFVLCFLLVIVHGLRLRKKQGERRYEFKLIHRLDVKELVNGDTALNSTEKGKILEALYSK